MEFVVNEISFQHKYHSLPEAEQELLALVDIYVRLWRESAEMQNKVAQSPCRIDGFQPLDRCTWKQIIGAMKDANRRKLCLAVLDRLAIKHAKDSEWMVDYVPCKAVSLAMDLGLDQGILLSLSAGGNYLKTGIEAENRIDGRTVTVKNIADPQHIDEYAEELDIRIFERSPKHGQAPKQFAKGVASSFDLDDGDAQKLLVRGTRYGKKIQAKRGEHYYTFQSHTDKYYHGYINDDLPESVRRKLDAGADQAVGGRTKGGVVP